MNRTYKKISMAIGFALLSSSLLAQIPFEVKGKMEGLATESVYLFTIANKKEVLLQKTLMQNGEFSFKGTIQAPELCNIRIGSHKFPIKYFFLDKGTTTYANSFDKEKGRPLVPTISGNKSQDLLNAYQNEERTIDDSLRSLRGLLYNKKESLTQDEVAAINVKMDNLYTKAEMLQYATISKLSNSMVAPYIISNSLLYGSSSAELKKYYKNFSPDIQRATISKEILDYATRLEKVDVGATVPNISLKTIDGQDFELASLKGKVYIIDFWASWCGPCRKENPSMVALYNDYHPKGLEMVGISLDKTHKAWKEAVEKDNLTWTHISDLKYWNSDAAKLFVVSAVPLTILVDQNGKIVARGLHGKALREAVENLLAK